MSDSEMLLYPLHRLLAIVDDQADMRRAVDTLEAAGFTDDEVTVLAGERGAAQIDAHGTHHGLLGRIVRAFEFATMDAITDAEQYEAAARAGHYVLAVHARDAGRRAQALDILRECGGHFINYYSRLVSELMEP